jgi:hypothetical protein
MLTPTGAYSLNIRRTAGWPRSKEGRMWRSRRPGTCKASMPREPTTSPIARLDTPMLNREKAQKMMAALNSAEVNAG